TPRLTASRAACFELRDAIVVDALKASRRLFWAIMVLASTRCSCIICLSSRSPSTVPLAAAAAAVSGGAVAASGVVAVFLRPPRPPPRPPRPRDDVTRGVDPKRADDRIKAAVLSSRLMSWLRHLVAAAFDDDDDAAKVLRC